MSYVIRFLKDTDGPTSVEYAVMLALIIGAIISAIGAVGSQTGGLWSNIYSSLNNVSFGGS
jgi:Flp pilus assembly pilin Flp